MLSFITWFRPSIPGWLTLDANPLDSLLQGFVGACGIIVFCNLIRVHLFLKTESSNNNDSSKEMLKTPGRHGYARLLSECLHFLFLTVILAVVGSRAASLVVLEFSLRAVSAWVTAGPESVATVAAISTINEHFLSATEALRFWTPLTICYTLLVVYMQEEQHCHPGGQAVINTVMMRLGALMVLMLTVGRWSDVVHIFLCFLGEAGCLIPSRDLLEVTTQVRYMEEVPTQCQKSEKRRRCLTTYKDD
ncbi:transmembrane protein 82 isoform X4 [Esox lucius]|uniref:transmembrane protein 82 isoform X4 n=1 Tax=Esox lucius TaxID=8010 RepID=UPI0005780F42|nr:transmembrane protein 82 isoform X4 [Esox lucius]